MKTVRNTTCILIALVMALSVMLLADGFDYTNAKKPSQKSLMKKTLKAYAAGNMKLASKYNKKMNKIVSEKCIKQMSETKKAAFRKVIKKWSIHQDLGTEPYLWDFFLTDFDNDGKTDMILRTGTCEADAVFTIYSYKKGKARKTGTFPGAHSMISKYPGTNGVIVMTAHMGNERFTHYYRKGGKIAGKSIGKARETTNYFELRNRLRSRVKYAEIGGPFISWGELRATPHMSKKIKAPKKIGLLAKYTHTENGFHMGKLFIVCSKVKKADGYQIKYKLRGLENTWSKWHTIYSKKNKKYFDDIAPGEGYDMKMTIRAYRIKKGDKVFGKSTEIKFFRPYLLAQKITNGEKKSVSVYK